MSARPRAALPRAALLTGAGLLLLLALTLTGRGYAVWLGGERFYPGLDVAARNRFVAGAEAG